ncbi:MAG: hypothetical protein Q7U53_17410 [Anaerolineaceae bacterium]|nr:hypothetical protein [Anaerolineaceae bacterium]
MKIRTDFVNNSSSYSSAEIVIDNPVLLEILQKYKDMGTFGEGEEDLSFSIGKFPEYGSIRQGTTETPAFSYDNPNYNPSICPSSIDDVLFRIIEYLDNEDIPEKDDDLFQLLINELESNEEKINKGFIKVFWRTNSSSNEHGEDYEGFIGENNTYEYENNIGEEYSFD